MARQRCDCPCPNHPGPPKDVLLVGVPPLSVRREAAGFIVGRVTTEGTTEAYFLAYERAGDGLRLVARPMPDAPPQSWLPAVARVREFLGAVTVS
jgi:hypothetical protein